jgi:hypothetical protein
MPLFLKKKIFSICGEMIIFLQSVVQISDMLSNSTTGRMMLCFVITLEQGRLKPGDRLTMELVFKALNQVLFRLLCV